MEKERNEERNKEIKKKQTTEHPMQEKGKR
jgi:hypothetical protein